MHKFVIWITTLVLGFSIYTHAEVKSSAHFTPEFDSMVNSWIQHLSKENSWKQWSEAHWTSYPLGPGTHGWVIILDQDHKQVGYLIVSSTQDGGFSLSEYGVGENPLFSLNTLYQSMMRLNMIPIKMNLEEFTKDNTISKERIYNDAFHAAWKVMIGLKSSFFDAATGENIPISDEALQTAQSNNMKWMINKDFITSTIISTLLLPGFDPYDNLFWIINPSLKITSFTDLESAISNKSPIVFTITLGDHEATIPYSVLGFQKWNNGDAFLLIQYEGIRYVPFKQFWVQSTGHFYR